MIDLPIVDRNGRLLYRVLDFFGRVLYNGLLSGDNMRIVKVLIKNNPQYFVLKRIEDDQLLVTYPTYKPDRFRMARWLNSKVVQVVWIKSFIGE